MDRAKDGRRRWQVRRSARVDGDSSNAPMHLDADGGPALASRGIAPMVAMLFQALDFDLADPAAGPGLDPGFGRQAHHRLSDPAMDFHGVVVLGWGAAQVEFDAARADVHFHAAQIELAENQPVLPGAAV